MHTNLKRVIRILFKQGFYRDLLHACNHHSSFYIFYDICFCNFKLSTCFKITSTKCHINAVVPPDDGPGDVLNMKRL
jgi:hypothetical protein